MKAAYPDNRGPAFNRPPNIIEELICQESGLLSTPYCPKIVREIFIEGNEPTRQCDLHRVSSYDLLDKDKDFRESTRKRPGTRSCRTEAARPQAALRMTEAFIASASIPP